MRDLHEDGTTKYAWGPTIAEIDIAAAWLEAEFGDGQRMALLSKNRAHWIMADLAVILWKHHGAALYDPRDRHGQYILDFTRKVLFLGQTENWEGVKTVLPSDCLLVTLPGVGWRYA